VGRSLTQRARLPPEVDVQARAEKSDEVHLPSLIGIAY
jgi:hypothetical protein